jgi:O-antigen/teichoic acid export membrane protein
MAVSIFLMVPITTFYLTVPEIGAFALLSLIAHGLMVPLNVGGNLVINAYYFSINESQKKELFSHLYVFEIILKLLCFCLILLIGEYVVKGIMKDYEDKFLVVFYLLSASAIFSSTKPMLNHFFTVRRESKRYFLYNFLDIGLLLLCSTVFLHYLGLGLIGYAAASFLSIFLFFVLDVNVIRRYTSFKYKKRWFTIIYLKGIRLFYANLVENFLNFYDSFIVQKVLTLGDLGLYSHSKQYVVKLGVLDKAFFQSYSVSYFKMLKGDEEPNIFKISLFWYSFLLLIGLCIVYLADDLIAILTHDKLTESAKYLSILYTLIFFRSNQMAYSYQILYHKENELFVKLATVANIAGMTILTLGAFLFDLGLSFIVWSFVLNVVLKNVAIKGYAIFKYKRADISEVFFWLSLFIYQIILHKEEVYVF